MTSPRRRSMASRMRGQRVPQSKGWETRRENQLIERFGPNSEQVRDFRATVLATTYGVHSKGIEERNLDRLSLKDVRGLAERKLSAREIKTLVNKERTAVDRLLDAGMTPDEIIRYRLTKPSRLEMPANQRRLAERREGLVLAKASQPEARESLLARGLSEIRREDELVRMGFPNSTTAERRALEYLGQQPTQTGVMRDFIRVFQARASELRRSIGMPRAQAARLAVQEMIQTNQIPFGAGSRVRSLRGTGTQGTAWHAFLAFLDQMYGEDEGVLSNAS